MLFNSLAFALFLPVVFAGYWLIGRRCTLRWQNLFVVAASYVFYGWWDVRFLLLIALTTLCSFLSGFGIARARRQAGRRAVLWSNIALNLGILGLFKYYNFFAENLRALLAPTGIMPDSVTLELILPVGISFYTFQALSYSIDVYRGRIAPTRDAVAFFAFISFFPQLVAGPIERATNLLPQFLAPRRFDYAQAVDGCRLILWGLFKKMVVADNCATLVNAVFVGADSFGGIDLWIGAAAFAFQIYGDFSGYSDIAIGTASLFGIRLMRNFRVPYFARDIAEFWRRWHISLTTWLRDYIYIPLGGSRCNRAKIVRNTFVIFLVSGFWHGAEWTFIAWGGYHAALFLPMILTGRNRRHAADTVASGRRLPAFGESLMMGATFLLVAVGWVIFRADNLTAALRYIGRMFSDFSYTPLPGAPMANLMLAAWIGVLLTVEWVYRDRPHQFAIASHGLMRHRAVREAAYLALALACLMFCGQQGEFIYFQF